MKKQVMVLLVSVLLMAGCSKSVTPTDAQIMAEKQIQWQQMAKTLQSASKDLSDSMVASGIIDPNLAAKITKISAEADKVEAQIAAISTAVKDVPLSGVVAQDWIALARAGNAAVPSPYTLPIEAALGLLSIILGIFVKKNADAAAESDSKYQAHKEGVELTMKQVSASPIVEVKAVETQLYNNIGNARATNGV